MKQLIAWKLNMLARMALKRHKPQIVGITGSVGKTSAKEAIYCVLKGKFRVRASAGSYNNEFGLPLAILGAETAGKNIFRWCGVFFKAYKEILSSNFPEVLVLEMGADKPGDIAKLLQVTGPLKVAVITDIGISHLQNYPGPKALAGEKLSLLKGVARNGVALLNIDSQNVVAALNAVKQEKMTYGFGQADLKATDMQIVRQNVSLGINFKMHYRGTVVPFFIPECLGQPAAYAALAAAGVALSFGLNLVNASEALREYKSPAGRLRLIEGIKRTWIIDDTYNAAPASTLAALDVLNQIASGRKMAVLGDMAELGAQTQSGHKSVAVKVQEVGVASAILVGQSGKIIFDELQARHFAGKSLWFETSDAARMAVQNEMVEGDTVLVKGSQAVRMEKIVKEVMATPMDAEKLLVRQSPTWLAKP